MPTQQAIIAATKKWLETVIVKYNFCPFARKELENDTIRYSVSELTSFDDLVELALTQCRFLDDHPQTATTLMILPNGFDNFDRYLDLVDLIQSQVIASTFTEESPEGNNAEGKSYEGIYQLASFHPDYCFADAGKDDAANYTNRAPFAMVHFLREDDLTEALADYPDPQSIPDRNIMLTRRKGSKKMAQLLADCHITTI
ncbi:MAG: DUF1415 domain-containing protein [Psychrosphaera sp.]|nr:DUF1415 domain-containing protein [Psychrosphaera sp.]